MARKKTDLICFTGPTIIHHYYAHAAAAKSLLLCLTLCDPINGSPPGSPVPGILQARTLEWVAISFSSAWKWKVKVKSLSRVRLSTTSWTVAYQAPPSMGFSRQGYWSGLPLPSPIMHIPYTKKSALGTEGSLMMKMPLFLRSFLSIERDRCVHKSFSHIVGMILSS